MDQWEERAAEAERGVLARHLRRVGGLPGTALGLVAWPPTLRERLAAGSLHYWWQAQLLDCLVDAQLRDPTQRRAKLIARHARSIRLRNRMSWLNSYYDDMAWLGLALLRAHEVTGLAVRRPLDDIVAQLHVASTRDAGGGIWWRRNDNYKNTPANGPAAILHARLGEHKRARELAQWTTEHLVSPETGLLWDGLRVDLETGEITEIVKRIYTYCQGVYLGACLEMASVDSGDAAAEWQRRAARTIDAVAANLAPAGILRGHGGGDGGLFAGVLARYLALAVERLPQGDAAETARRIVMASAEGCWANATRTADGPLFGPDWSKPVSVPGRDDGSPERQLSVQVGGWQVLEAAARLPKRPSEDEAR